MSYNELKQILDELNRRTGEILELLNELIARMEYK